MNLCIIPARGGSKRIPRKNIKLFCGRPIIEYPIRVALEVFDHVMVSTDHPEIARIGFAAGASVPFYRSAETSTDSAETEDVIEEVLDRYAGIGMEFDRCCVLYPCSVFAKTDDLRRAMADEYEMVMSVVEYDYPPQRAIRLDPVRLVDREMHDAESGQLETLYHDAAQFYAFHVSAFRKAWEEGRRLLEMDGEAIMLPRGSVWDIDTEDDWRIAEVLYEA